MIGCLFNPVGCANDYLASIPWDFVIPALVVGMILGAVLGKVGTGAVLAIAAGFAFISKRRSGDELHEHVGGKDAVPPAKPKRKRPTLARALGLEK